MAEGSPLVGLQLLGPVRAHAGDLSLPLGGGKARGVLAMLALRRPHAVQLHELASGLWGDDAPPSAVATLQAYLSRLRSTLGAEAVVGGRAGYRLMLDPQVVDVDRFHDLLDQARAAVERDGRAAAELVEAALAQWQGRALADVLDLPGAAAAAAGLETERLSALELLFSLRLGLGQHALALPRLQELVAEHPLDEQFARQLMLALYRSGRQGEALEVYTRLRAGLVRDLGVEPAPETRSLQRAVLGRPGRHPGRGAGGAGAGQPPGGAHVVRRAPARAGRAHGAAAPRPPGRPRRAGWDRQDPTRHRARPGEPSRRRRLARRPVRHGAPRIRPRGRHRGAGRARAAGRRAVRHARRRPRRA